MLHYMLKLTNVHSNSHYMQAHDTFYSKRPIRHSIETTLEYTQSKEVERNQNGLFGFLRMEILYKPNDGGGSPNRSRYTLPSLTSNALDQTIFLSIADCCHTCIYSELFKNSADVSMNCI